MERYYRFNQDEVALLEKLIRTAVMQLANENKQAEDQTKTDKELEASVRLLWKIENLMD
jgi:membrane protein required for beta-lactamase induction